MTCVVGVMVPGRGVWMGADSLGAAGHVAMRRRDPKVFRVGHVMIGFTGSYRMGQALMFGWEPPAPPTGNPLKWMCTDFVDSVRTRLGAAGVRQVENGVETGHEFLVAVAGELFGVDTDFQVRSREVPYDACGSGAEVALGALYAYREMQKPSCEEVAPDYAIRLALSAAQELNSYVREPFRVMSTTGAIS